MMTGSFLQFLRDARTGRIATRLIWAALVMLTITLYVSAIPVRFSQLQTPTPMGDNALVLLSPAEALELERHGVTTTMYALYFVILETVFTGAYVLIGWTISWRKGGEWLAMFASLAMITFGALIPGTLRVLDSPTSGLELLVHLIQVLGWSSFFTCFLVFPDGTFVPRWGRFALVLFALWGIAWILLPEANAFNWPVPLALLAFSGVLTTGVAAQAYRFRYVSRPSERLQTKWVILGFAGATAGTVVFLIPSLIWPFLQEPGWSRVLYHVIGIALFALSLLLIPASIDLAMRRYKLWAIDPLVNRALVYSLLTLALALIYGACVVLLQGLLTIVTGRQQAEIVTVASTLTMAALFSPLRRRIQETIDRRFFREKYDAARTLAAFAAAARDEVDLAHLSDDLLAVVYDVIKPTHLALWLKDAEAESRQQKVVRQGPGFKEAGSGET